MGFHTVAGETADSHDTAYKGAVTDALKRGLRSFGDQFPNSLNGDSSSAADVVAPSLRQTLLELGVTQGFDEGRCGLRSRAKRTTVVALDLDDGEIIDIAS